VDYKAIGVINISFLFYFFYFPLWETLIHPPIPFNFIFSPLLTPYIYSVKKFDSSKLWNPDKKT